MGIYFITHGFRSSFITDLEESTKDIFLTSQVIGHSSISTTQRYIAYRKENVAKEAVKQIRG
jgi:integrase